MCGGTVAVGCMVMCKGGGHRDVSKVRLFGLVHLWWAVDHTRFDISVIALHDARVCLGWALLGIIFFFRSHIDHISKVQSGYVQSSVQFSRCPFKVQLPDTVPIRSRTWTLRPSAILRRHLPCHTIPYHASSSMHVSALVICWRKQVWGPPCAARARGSGADHKPWNGAVGRGTLLCSW